LEAGGNGRASGLFSDARGEAFYRMNDAGFLQPWLAHSMPTLYASTWWWSAVGFAGNIMFGSRFILQWIASERKHALVVPGYFWQLSFWGSVLNLVYALHLDSAPLLLGVVALPFIYGRNLVLLRRCNEQEKDRERHHGSGLRVRASQAPA
jgi:lipid-A-disaccharide synthase-like uncharacterized protein